MILSHPEIPVLGPFVRKSKRLFPIKFDEPAISIDDWSSHILAENPAH
jgi:hypothetical protein